MRPSQLIPSRFRTQNVERFLPALRAICSGVPRFTFDAKPLGLAPTTAVARLRDAVISYSEGYATDPSIHPVELSSKWQDYYATVDAGTIIVALKSEEKHATAQGVATPVRFQAESVGSAVISKAQTTEATLRALALLFGLRILTSPVKFPSTALSDSLRSELLSKHDIAFVDEGNGFTMIL